MPSIRSGSASAPTSERASVLAVHASARDLRIDFFRGLALFWIFLNHIPGNAFSWLTSRNYGLSDATEVFVFLAGISSTIAYGKTMDRAGFMQAWKAGAHRAFSIYHSHLMTAFVLLGLSLGLACLPMRADPLAYNLFVPLVEATQAGDFAHFGQLFALSYRPMNMDVLPLYVVLLALVAPLLWLARRHPVMLATMSIALWIMARNAWSFPDYRPGHGWTFNPFAWQLLFVTGILTALHGGRIRPFLDHKAAKAFAVLAIMGCSTIVLSWYLEPMADAIPTALAEWIYPLSKMNLDVLRLIHFAAVLVLMIPVLPASASWLKSRIAALFILCGRHSLQVFSLGIVLSFVGHIVLIEVSASLFMQAVVSAAGCAILIGQAAWLERKGKRKKGAQNQSGRASRWVAG